MTRAIKRTGRLVLLVLIVGAIMLMALPTGAQNQAIDTCVARDTGSFSCQVTIPSRIIIGDYNLVAECPQGGTSSAYPPGSGDTTGPLTVSTNRVNPGQTLTASGSGCVANSLVEFRLERLGPLALANLFTGVAEAQTGTRTMTARISVVAPGSGGTAAASSGAAASGTRSVDAAPKGSLVRTGMAVLPWLAGGFAALALGGVLVMAGRRRMRKSSLPAS